MILLTAAVGGRAPTELSSYLWSAETREAAVNWGNVLHPRGICTDKRTLQYANKKSWSIFLSVLSCWKTAIFIFPRGHVGTFN